MTAARKLTAAELVAWERFANEALGARLAQLQNFGDVRADVLAQYAAADADALIREWRRRAGRDAIRLLDADRYRELQARSRGGQRSAS